MFVGYRGDLPHYLLLTWLSWRLAGRRRRIGRPLAPIASRSRGSTSSSSRLIAVAVIFVASNWAAHDQSGQPARRGRTRGRSSTSYRRTRVLLTYWDTLTTLGYVHCIEGQRPDLTMIAARPRADGASCDLLTAPLDVSRATGRSTRSSVRHAARECRPAFDLVTGGTFKVPYGHRLPEFNRPLYRLQPKAAPAADMTKAAGGADGLEVSAPGAREAYLNQRWPASMTRAELASVPSTKTIRNV